MESTTWANVIAAGALTLAVLTAIASSVGFFVNRREVKESQRAAVEAAQRAERSVQQAQRAADAQERIAEHFSDMLSRQEKRDQRQWASAVPTMAKAGNPYMSGGGSMPGPRPAVHWTVDRIKGKRYALRNLGTGTAREVIIAAENTARFDGPSEPLTIEGHAGEVSFLAIGSWQTGTPELVVRWIDDDGEHEWRRVLP